MTDNTVFVNSNEYNIRSNFTLGDTVKYRDGEFHFYKKIASVTEDILRDKNKFDIDGGDLKKLMTLKDTNSKGGTKCSGKSLKNKRKGGRKSRKM